MPHNQWWVEQPDNPLDIVIDGGESWRYPE